MSATFDIKRWLANKRASYERAQDEPAMAVALELTLEKINTYEALIDELDDVLALITDDETPFHLAYNAARAARAKIQAANGRPMGRAVRS